MRWTSCVSVAEEPATVLREIRSQIEQQLCGTAPDLLIAFVSPHFSAYHGALSRGLNQAFEGATLIGCSADGVAGAFVGAAVVGAAVVAIDWFGTIYNI